MDRFKRVMKRRHTESNAQKRAPGSKIKVCYYYFSSPICSQRECCPRTNKTNIHKQTNKQPSKEKIRFRRVTFQCKEKTPEKSIDYYLQLCTVMKHAAWYLFTKLVVCIVKERYVFFFFVFFIERVNSWRHHPYNQPNTLPIELQQVTLQLMPGVV